MHMPKPNSGGNDNPNFFCFNAKMCASFPVIVKIGNTSGGSKFVKCNYKCICIL